MRTAPAAAVVRWPSPAWRRRASKFIPATTSLEAALDTLVAFAARELVLSDPGQRRPTGHRTHPLPCAPTTAKSRWRPAAPNVSGPIGYARGHRDADSQLLELLSPAIRL